MKKTQRSLVNSENKSFIVISKGDRDISCIFCPMCDFVMSSYGDIESFNEYSCCRECFLTFVESRKNLWKKGWRPSEDDINNHKNNLRCNPPVFILN